MKRELKVTLTNKRQYGHVEKAEVQRVVKLYLKTTTDDNKQD